NRGPAAPLRRRGAPNRSAGALENRVGYGPPAAGVARVGASLHQPASGKLPYRFAPARHRRIRHRGNCPDAWHQPGGSQDAPAPRPPGPPLSSGPAFSGGRPMNCREFTEFLHEYLFGNLPAGERSEFDKHLAECPWCVAYLDSYRKTIELEQAAFASPGDAPPPSDAPEELVQAILRARPCAS